MLPYDQSLIIIPTYNEIDNIERMIKTVFELYPQISPNAVQRFKKLVESKAYDNSAFHRVIKDTLVQAGDLEFGKKGSLNYAKIGTGKSGLGTINSEIDTPFDFKIILIKLILLI